jgi:hypothetical protein
LNAACDCGNKADVRILRDPAHLVQKEGNSKMKTSNIIALRQRKVELVRSAKSIMSVGNTEGRDLTAAEDQSLGKIHASLADIKKQIVAAERELAEEANMPMTPGREFRIRRAQILLDTGRHCYRAGKSLEEGEPR